VLSYHPVKACDDVLIFLVVAVAIESAKFRTKCLVNSLTHVDDGI